MQTMLTLFNKNRVFFLVVFALLILCVIFFARSNPTVQKASTPIFSVTPTPFPFQEITIPFLRDRSYKSALGNLEEIAQTGSYTSYLTSFDSDGLKVNGLLTKPLGEVPSGGFPAI